MLRRPNANAWRSSFVFTVALSLAGCGLVPPRPGKWDARRDEVLDRYFTEEAAEILNDVPLNEGQVNLSGSFAVGDDWGSQLASWVYGNGAFRQVLIQASSDEFNILHEYVHQADYSGLIDRELFRTRLKQLRADDAYRAIVEEAEASIRGFYSLNFLNELALAYNDGSTREMIAYLIKDYMRGYYDLPDYVLEVYSSVLRPIAIEVR